MSRKRIFYFLLITAALSFIGMKFMVADLPTAEIKVVTGVPTVGVGATVSLVANEGDTTLTAFSWTLIGPVGSTAVLDDDAVQTPSFVPDVEGVYELTATVTDAGGTSDPAELTIYAGTFVGVGTMAGADADYATGQCGYACHTENTESWAETRHATAFENRIDGISTSSFADYCLSCHTVGYNTDSTAVNGGFDDIADALGWTFPDTLVVGNFDSLAANYPELAQVASIGCESCHGPGSGHKGDTEDNRIASNLTDNNCGVCHGQDDQLANSRHQDKEEFRTYTGRCEPCHSGTGFIAEFDDDYAGKDINVGDLLSCQTCHDPHAVDEVNNPYQLRTLDAVELGDTGDDEYSLTVTVDDAGYGILCINCHKSRRDAVSYVREEHGTHFGPHHGPQADVVFGTNGIEFGVEVQTSTAHSSYFGNLCVDCHMNSYDSHADDPPGDVRTDFNDDTFTDEFTEILADNAYGHTFFNSYTDDDSIEYDNLQKCQTCHYGATSFDINMRNIDHDGDGTVEGFQSEIDGLMEELADRIVAETDSVEVCNLNLDSEFLSPAGRLAFYNWAMVEEDGSRGVHNPDYILTLIAAANAALDAGDIAANDIVDVVDVPNDQGKQVRVSWEMFDGDPNLLSTYAVWRKVNSTAKASGRTVVEVADFSEMYKQVKNSENKLFKIAESEYDFIGEVPAVGDAFYSIVAPTLFDSTITNGANLTYFKVSGHSSTYETVFSADAAGYSLDNLAPAAPQSLAFSVSTKLLAWSEPVDDDFNYFAIYRGTVSGFTPDEGNRLGFSTTNSFVDTELSQDGTYYYKVTAVDFSGNEGESSSEYVAVVTSVDEGQGIPEKFGLAQNYPNPFNPSTVIGYQLPAASEVKLIIYNIIGQEVRTLVNTYESAGYKKITWNGLDNSGNHVAPGIYLYRLQAGDFVSINKMAYVK